MSSNIRLTRICQHCSNEFTAKTTVTMYCGDICAKRAYKKRKQVEKIETSINQTKQLFSKPIEEIKAKEYLSIVDACKLLGISRWTIYRAINNKGIKANKIGTRTIIKRTEIDKFFL